MLVVWKRSPLLRLFLPFAIGIAIQVCFAPNVAMVIGVLICFSMVACIIHFRKKRLHYSHRHFPAMLYFVIFFLMGDVVVHISDPRLRDSYFTNFTREGSVLRIRLLDAPIEKDKSVKLTAEVMAVMNEDYIQHSVGQLLVYLKKDSSSLHLHVDDEVWISAGLNKIAGQKNPEEFDYANYQGYHHVYFQSYADSSHWKFSKRPDRHSFIGWFISCREYLLQILDEHHIEDREFAVLSALVLGKSTGIDAELMSAYAGVGAVHVLAVSGLHVALIYVLLAPLMKKLLHSNKWRLIKTIIPTLLLWTYAGITGFSPSVLRAALMFTFFIVADNYQKQNNIYNTMSASALVLLIYNPMMLLELGFQLSYLAVLGIVVLQQKIVTLFYPGNKLLIWAWKLTAVSIAAQIATFPITIYYFHQFPNYFLLSNFLVIPLSTLILYISLSFFAFSWVPVLANFLAQLSAFLTRIMNDIMIRMNELPQSVTDGISISLPDAICISGMIVFFSGWLFWKKSKALLPAIVFTFILCCFQLDEKCHILQKDEVCFHSIRGGWCISGIISDKAYLIGSHEMVSDERNRKFHIQSYWDKTGVEESVYLDVDSMRRYEDGYCKIDFPLMQIGDKRILFIDSTSLSHLDDVKFDYCMIDGSDRKLFFSDSSMKYFESKTILLGEKVRVGMKQYLWEHLSETARFFNLADGAVICRNDTTAHFSAWR